MPFQTIAGRSDGVFWWFPALSEDQKNNCRIHQNHLVALNCIALLINSTGGTQSSKVNYRCCTSSIQEGLSLRWILSFRNQSIGKERCFLWRCRGILDWTLDSGSKGSGFRFLSMPGTFMSFSKTLYPHCCSPPRCINGYPVGCKHYLLHGVACVHPWSST